MRYSDLISEDFNDLGRLSPDELKKGQRLDPKQDDNFHQVDARVFARVLGAIKSNDIEKLNQGLPSKGIHSLSIYKIEEYRDMRCFVGKNNSSGFALHGDEMVSIFSSQRSSGDAIVGEAVRNGARRVDCFATRNKEQIDGPAVALYNRHGFVIDESINKGTPGEAYAIVNGVSDFVDDAGNTNPDDPRVVVFMHRP